MVGTISNDARKPARPRRRRKEARPSEIVEAALDVFGEHGFGAARLEDVARRAGVAKGTVFVYFANKEELFRAVAQSVLASHLEKLGQVAADIDMPLAQLVPALLMQAAAVGEGRVPPMARLIVGESRHFPDLARMWHDEVVAKVFGLLAAAIERAQERGEVRPGDPRLFAFSIVGPMLSAVLFREVFGRVGVEPPDLRALACQHAETVLSGLLVPPGAG